MMNDRPTIAFASRPRTFVVKVGGAAGIDATRLLDDLAKITTEDPAVRIVLVHGGSDATTALQRALGAPARFLESPDGRTSRFTDRAAVEAFAMATAGINRALVEGLGSRGVRAFGLSGLDGGVLRAVRKDTVRAVEDGRTRVVRDQWTGRIEDVDTAPLAALLAAGLTPVVAPLAAGANGEMLNVDGDRAAAALAIALGADALVVLSNVPGLLRSLDEPASLIPRIASAEDRARARTCARGRMTAKFDAAERALAGGVQQVVLADARCDGPVSRALAGQGTVFEPQDPAGPGDRGEPEGIRPERDDSEGVLG